MFAESPWSRKTVGDVDVLFHEGLYHLFHLVLPNHDFVAHAISDNGLNWRRIDNALFIGNPGSWDDLMPPPKRLIRTAEGQLKATTFEQIERRVIGSLDICCFHPLKKGNSHQSCNPVGHDGLRIASEHGFQAFAFDAPVECFSLSAKITMTGVGKCGLLYRVDPHSRDGYYVSLDLMQGVAQLRAWGCSSSHCNRAIGTIPRHAKYESN